MTVGMKRCQLTGGSGHADGPQNQAGKTVTPLPGLPGPAYPFSSKQIANGVVLRTICLQASTLPKRQKARFLGPENRPAGKWVRR